MKFLGAIIFKWVFSLKVSQFINHELFLLWFVKFQKTITGVCLWLRAYVRKSEFENVKSVTTMRTCVLCTYGLRQNSLQTKGNLISEIFSSWLFSRDSRRMSYEPIKKWVCPYIYPPQILMICMYIDRKLALQTKIF